MKRFPWILIGIIIVAGFILLSVFLTRQRNIIQNAEDTNRPGEDNIHNGDDVSYMETPKDKEGVMMQLISEGDSEENLKKLLRLFPDIDFDKMENIYGEASVLEVLKWLSRQDIKREEDIVLLIEMIDDFYREEYSVFIESIANAYTGDKEGFIRALFKVPNRIRIVAYALHDAGVYDRSGQSISDDVKMIINSNELTDDERNIGIDLIKEYTRCGT